MKSHPLALAVCFSLTLSACGSGSGGGGSSAPASSSVSVDAVGNCTSQYVNDYNKVVMETELLVMAGRGSKDQQNKKAQAVQNAC